MSGRQQVLRRVVSTPVRPRLLGDRTWTLNILALITLRIQSAPEAGISGFYIPNRNCGLVVLGRYLVCGYLDLSAYKDTREKDPQSIQTAILA